MENGKIKVTKHDLSVFINGHGEANKFIQEEKKKRLRQLTGEESRFEYEQLCALWEQASPQEREQLRERQKLAFLIEKRRRLNQAGNMGDNK